MVYGSLSLIAFLLFLKSYGASAQCPGRLELPPASNIPSTAYIQPVGQVCFPAVIQIPDYTPPPPSPPQDDDDDYLNLIYLLISALTGSNKSKCNSNSNSNSNERNSNNQNTYPIPSSGPRNPNLSSGYVDITSLINGPCSYPSPCGCFDITSLINCPTSYPGPVPVPSSSPNPPNSNSNPITISIDTSGVGTGCLCDACNSNPFANLNLFPGIPSGNPSCGPNINAPAPSYISDGYNAGNGCIYVPYPVPVPYNVPGYNFDSFCYPDNEYGPQEINLYIKTECD